MNAIQSIISNHRKWKKIGLVTVLLGLISLVPIGKKYFPMGNDFISFADSSETTKKEGDMEDKNQLTEEEGRYLLQVARKTIEKALFKQEGEIEEGPTSEKYQEKRGTFVTLNSDGNLRGCIGHIIPGETLIEGIRINAINAAFRDPRFPPLNKKEWPHIKIEISILTEPKQLAYKNADDLLAKLRPGIDGVILKKDFRQSTFLPQVWEQLPDKEEFLTHLCLKGGMNAYAWKKEKLEVSTYQVQAFEED
jgi:AmmeMemoRadiSam system protein A